MQIKIRFGNDMRQHLYTQLKQAYVKGAVRLIKRVHALLYIADDKSVAHVAEMLGLGEQTIRDYIPEFAALIDKVDNVLVRFANTPKEITTLMGRYYKSLGASAA